MNKENELKNKIETYLDMINKEDYPIIWSYCQVDSEKVRIKNLIFKKLMDMANPNLDSVLSQIENQLNGYDYN